jgi:hypothetical protein
MSPDARRAPDHADWSALVRCRSPCDGRSSSSFTGSRAIWNIKALDDDQLARQSPKWRRCPCCAFPARDSNLRTRRGSTGESYSVSATSPLQEPPESMLQDDISYLGESAYLGPACERMQPSGTLKWRCLRENPRAYNFRSFAHRRPRKTLVCTALNAEYLPWRRSAV